MINTRLKMVLTGLVLVCFLFASVRLQGLLDTAKNPFQYLEEHNYKYENHTIKTEDGYKLLLVRLCCKENENSNRSKPAILFVHGVLAMFYDFLVAGPGISLGFKALEQGYDVFLLNTRGNTFSRSHSTLDPVWNEEEFWNFSWHEIGLYDLPATIDHILKITGKTEISYVGYSEGCTSFFVATSTKPEYNGKIKIAVLIAPPVYMKHVASPIMVALKSTVNYVENTIEALGIHELLPYSRLRNGQLMCHPQSPMLQTCKTEFYEKIAGPSTQINDTIISAYFTNIPAGASAKQLLHYLQLSSSGKFRAYDHGLRDNLVRYGRSTPPDYNLRAVSASVALFYGSTDYYVSTTDVNRLVSELPNVIKTVLISEEQTNHFDVLVGSKIDKLLNQPVMSLLNKYNDL